MTRHIDIRYFFIKDRIDTGDITVEYLHTKSMIADYLTKPLVGELFYKLRDLLLGYTTLWEGCALLWKINFPKKAYGTSEISNTYHLYSISRDIDDLNSFIRHAECFGAIQSREQPEFDKCPGKDVCPL